MKNDLINQALMCALREKMKEKPLNRIRVQELTDYCKLSRHTFYNHFQDVYALLTYMYENEVIEGVEECASLERWKEGMKLLLDYTEKNRKICLNTFHSLGRDLLESFVEQTFQTLVGGVVSDLSREIRVTEKDRALCTAFFAEALVGIFVHWLKTGLAKPSAEMSDDLNRVLDGAVADMMRRLAVNVPATHSLPAAI